MLAEIERREIPERRVDDVRRVALSVLRCSAVLWRIRMASIWLDTVATESSLPRSSSGNPQSTTMRMSTPISRATSMGRFEESPPSTSMRPSASTGENTPGADRLARIAVVRSPRSRITRSPVTMSVAMARNGMARSSKSWICATGSVSPRRICVSFCPCTRPRGRRNLPPLRPSGNFTRKFWSSSLRRKLSELRGGLSRNASCQSTEVITRSMSAAESPEAYRPPTTAPMLVPAMASTGTWFSSSTLSTPM